MGVQVTSVTARPCRASLCGCVHAHLAGGCPALPLLKARPPAASGGCCRCAMRRLVDPPRGAYSRCWHPAAQFCRGGRGGGGARWRGWPLEQQCLTPLPTAAQAAHCLCWCVSHTHNRRSRGRASGRLVRGHLPEGVKRVRPACVWGHFSCSSTWYCGPHLAPLGSTGPA